MKVRAGGRSPAGAERRPAQPHRAPVPARTPASVPEHGGEWWMHSRAPSNPRPPTHPHRARPAGGWVAWKQPGDKAAAGGDLFVSGSFYNLLCPQRPTTV